MAETVQTKAESFASLGARAITKITANLLSLANKELKH